MSTFVELYKQKHILHHAYVVISQKTHEAADAIKQFFKEAFGIESVSNPDFHHLKFKTLTIDDARGITEKEAVKNLKDGRKVFIIETDFITDEAQNSLLKVFEEPKDGTHFFIVSPQDVLLPTLKSRMQILSHESSEETKESILKLSISERMEKVKEITEAISDEEKTKQDAVALVNAIQGELYKSGVEKNATTLEACEKARVALYDRGAPVKMILENLMLSL